MSRKINLFGALICTALGVVDSQQGNYFWLAFDSLCGASCSFFVVTD